MSNIVPVVDDFGPRFINWIFERVTRYPTKLYLLDLATVEQRGALVTQPYFPYQLFLVPSGEWQFLSQPGHDFREDLMTLPADTVLYRVFAVDPQLSGSPDRQALNTISTIDSPGYRQQATEIAQLITTSPFIASDYGDRLLFFRHQRFGNR